MKKYFKQYKQALSAVLISMMVLQPISSLPSAWATEYDPEAVFDIEDEDAWLYEDEEDGNIYSRAAVATDSNAGKWGVTGFTLSAGGTAKAGESYTITGTITAADPASPSNSSWTSWASASNAASPEDAVSKANISVNSNGLFADDASLAKTLSGSGYTDLTITGTTAAELTTSQYTVTVTMFGVDEMVTITAEATSPEDPTTPEEGEITGSFDPEELILSPGQEGESTLTIHNTMASPSDAVIIEAVTYQSNDENVAVVSGHGTNKVVVTAKELAEGDDLAETTISAMLGETKIASLRVEVNNDVKVKSSEVNTDSAKPDFGNAPDDVLEDMQSEYESAVADIAGNRAVTAVAPSLDPGSGGWARYGIPAGSIVYPLQTLGTISMGYYRDTDGSYKTFVEKVDFDIDLYWKSSDEDEGKKANDVKDGKFTFRIPVPSNIRQGMNYAVVKHEGKNVENSNSGYLPINKHQDGWYVQVTVSHLSPFELTFAAEQPKPSTPVFGGGSSSGGGGGSRSVSSSIPNLSGQWILDANQRWWFSLTGGGYPANAWGRINNKWYYFDEFGYMMIGWLKLADTWYFLQPAGDMVENDWVFYNNQWYFLEANGAMAANKWISYKNNWYYFNANGDMAVSTITPDGYMVDANGIWIQ